MILNRPENIPNLTSPHGAAPSHDLRHIRLLVPLQSGGAQLVGEPIAAATTTTACERAGDRRQRAAPGGRQRKAAKISINAQRAARNAQRATGEQRAASREPRARAAGGGVSLRRQYRHYHVLTPTVGVKINTSHHHDRSCELCPTCSAQRIMATIVILIGDGV